RSTASSRGRWTRPWTASRRLPSAGRSGCRERRVPGSAISAQPWTPSPAAPSGRPGPTCPCPRRLRRRTTTRAGPPSDAGCGGGSAPQGVGGGSFHVAAGVALRDRLALVPELLAPGDGDLDLDPVVLQVEAEGDERQPAQPDP